MDGKTAAEPLGKELTRPKNHSTDSVATAT